MIKHLELFWDVITLPLSWLPPFCIKVIETLITTIAVVVVVTIVSKVWQVIKGK